MHSVALSILESLAMHVIPMSLITDFTIVQGMANKCGHQSGGSIINISKSE